MAVFEKCLPYTLMCEKFLRIYYFWWKHFLHTIFITGKVIIIISNKQVEVNSHKESYYNNYYKFTTFN